MDSGAARAESLMWTYRQREAAMKEGSYAEMELYDAMMPATAMGYIVKCEGCGCTHADPIDCACCSYAQGYICPNCGEIDTVDSPTESTFVDMDPVTEAVLDADKYAGERIK